MQRTANEHNSHFYVPQLVKKETFIAGQLLF